MDIRCGSNAADWSLSFRSIKEGLDINAGDEDEGPIIKKCLHPILKTLLSVDQIKGQDTFSEKQEHPISQTYAEAEQSMQRVNYPVKVLLPAQS